MEAAADAPAMPQLARVDLLRQASAASAASFASAASRGGSDVAGPGAPRGPQDAAEDEQDDFALNRAALPAEGAAPAAPAAPAVEDEQDDFALNRPALPAEVAAPAAPAAPAVEDHPAFDWSGAGSLPVPPALAPDEPPERTQCAVCGDGAGPPLPLPCGHAYCSECMTGQLAARWPGPNVSFGFLRCAVCRAPIEHFEDRKLAKVLAEHASLRRRAVDAAVRRFRGDGLDVALGGELGRPASEEEARDRAERLMAVYMCADCADPYCGGRLACAEQEALDVAQLRCRECEWQAIAGTEDRRCMVHGHRYAVFKCDFCCALAVWDCGFAHFCDSCHNDHNGSSKKPHPCPGPGLCPLGIPHPKNDSHDAKGKHFVIGCSACMGCGLAQEFGHGRAFGYPARDWQALAGGEAVLAACGEEEMDARLRAKVPPALLGGAAAERAERLLLLELGADTPEALLQAAGGAEAAGGALPRRLEAVGLDGDGTALERARRLLLVLRAEGPENLHQLDRRERARAAAAVRAAARRAAMTPQQVAQLERRKLAIAHFLARERQPSAPAAARRRRR